jgi:hypothetical protein
MGGTVAFPATWWPIKVRDLVRVGNTRDGGYVLPSCVLSGVDTLVSFGLCDDWLFETDFATRCPEMRILCFDHTVDGKMLFGRFLREMAKVVLVHPNRNLRKALTIARYRLFFDGRRRRHIRRMIGDPLDNGVDLRMVFEMLGVVQKCSVFLKIDIESYEYAILDQIADFAPYLRGMAIEFHSCDVRRDDITTFIDKISPHLLVSHFHPNNGALDAQGEPVAVELCFVNRSLLSPPIEPATHKLPLSGLDSRNVIYMPDISVAFAD